VSATETRLAVGSDWPYVEALRRREGDALGFIPKDRYLSVLEERPSHGRNRWHYERVLLASDDGEPTGFCYAGFPRTGVAKLWQVCVQEDARRWHRALLLVGKVEAEARRRGMRSVEARVAADLDANLFWRAAGYEVIGESVATFLAHKPAKSARLIMVYRKVLSEPIQPALWTAS
jgi:GNAT superfamily N-acetyltransferase